MKPQYHVLVKKAIEWDRKLDNLISYIFSLWRIWLSFILFIILILFTNNVDSEKFITITRSVAIISSIMSGLIIGYLTSMTIQIRREKRERHTKLHDLTQQVHNFRRILHVLVNYDEFWEDGLILYMNSRYKNLSFFQLREGVNSVGFPLKIVNQYHEDNKYGNVRQLYLEIKSIVQEDFFDKTLYSDYEENEYFTLQITEKWFQHYCGNGLWYFLDEHYSLFKSKFDFTVFPPDAHIKARELAMKIDSDRFSNFKLAPKDIGTLGSFMHGNVFEKLYHITARQNEGLPKLFNYLYVVLSSLIIFGVIFPIIGLLLNFNQNIILYSTSLTIAVAFYILISFYNKLKTTI